MENKKEVVYVLFGMYACNQQKHFLKVCKDTPSVDELNKNKQHYDYVSVECHDVE